MISLFAPFLFLLVGAAVEGGADGGGRLGGGGDEGGRGESGGGDDECWSLKGVYNPLRNISSSCSISHLVPTT